MSVSIHAAVSARRECLARLANLSCGWGDPLGPSPVKSDGPRMKLICLHIDVSGDRATCVVSFSEPDATALVSGEFDVTVHGVTRDDTVGDLIARARTRLTSAAGEACEGVAVLA